VRTSEWVIVAYFLYLLASGAFLRARARAILRVAALAVPTCGVVVLVAHLPLFPIAPILRDWLPGAWLMVGYWATGLLYRGPARALEAWLEAFDIRLLAWLQRRGARLPSAAAQLLEFAYLFCYPLVPAGVAVLYATGQRSRADSYWTLVLSSAFAAYSVLPWAGTRPPRTLEAGGGPARGRDRLLFRRVNLAVLAHGSIHVNTFPSGHAASACAVTLFVATVPGAPWVVFALFAAAIGAGAIAGRYHFALDVVAGVVVAVAAFVLLARSVF
jgi:membrane-associated phospholipid phosphatase